MRLVSMSAGVAVTLVGLGLVFPQVANWRDESPVQVALLVLGSAISLGGISLALFADKLRHA